MVGKEAMVVARPAPLAASSSPGGSDATTAEHAERSVFK